MGLSRGTHYIILFHLLCLWTGFGKSDNPQVYGDSGKQVKYFCILSPCLPPSLPPTPPSLPPLPPSLPFLPPPSLSFILLLSLVNNRRLLDKFQLYERQQQELQGGGDQTGEDVEEVLTPDEKENVERVKRSIAKLVTITIFTLHNNYALLSTLLNCIFQCRLEHGELQLDETVMTIIDYVHRHTSP